VDDRAVTVAEQLAAAPRTSVEKLDDLLGELAGATGEDAGQRLLITTFRPMLPLLRTMGYIPTDPDELDRLLLIGARMALGLRSDQSWQPETMNDLFLGPDEGQEPPEEAADAPDHP
jgi:hypothetical protein